MMNLLTAFDRGAGKKRGGLAEGLVEGTTGDGVMACTQ